MTTRETEIKKRIINIIESNRDIKIYKMVFNLLSENNSLKNYSHNSNGVFFNISNVSYNTLKSIENNILVYIDSSDYEKTREKLLENEIKNNTEKNTEVSVNINNYIKENNLKISTEIIGYLSDNESCGDDYSSLFGDDYSDTSEA